MTGDKNPRRKEGLTPLDQADGKAHFEAYTFIMEKLKNKSTGNKRGKTPFHVDAKSIDNNISSDMYGVTHFHIAAELGHF